MFSYKSQISSIVLLSLTLITVKTQDDEIFSNLIDGGVNSMQNFKADFYFMENKIQALAPEKVDIKLYYECLCPDCRNFDTMSLKPTVEKLASYLNLHLYPYGNAQTIDKGNGVYEFKCQHGPDECYGNKLHACAIDYLANVTKAVFFNSCMMESSRNNRGSTDKAADACGNELHIDPEWIKQCAKGPRGIAICDPSNTGYSTRTRNNIAHRNGTSNISSEVTTLKDKVEIKVYYETLCPFSVNFFVYQLKPAMERLGTHLDIHLIPYGHAKTHRVLGGYKFSCQHGIPECFGNTVQACAIDVLRNVTRTVNFNTCLMQNTSYRTGYQSFIFVFHWCGNQHDVNVQEIWECLNSRRGSVLLKGHGDETHALAPSFVPYLTIDGSTEYQDQAMSNLFATVCLMLKPMPRECTMI